MNRLISFFYKNSIVFNKRIEIINKIFKIESIEDIIIKIIK